MLVSFHGIWLIIKLPPAVSELTFLPDVFKLKLPAELVGASPAIKPSEAGVQVGVSGKAPYWLATVTLRVAEAELTEKSRARQQDSLRFCI